MTEAVRSFAPGGRGLTLAATLALAVLVGVLFAPTMKGLALEWASSPDSSYGALLAGIALLVAWQRRRLIASLVDHQARGHRSGLGLLLVGLLAYVVGIFGADVFVTRLSFVIIIAGITWYLAGGRAARAAAAPIVFLLLAIPLPALIVNAVTLPLQLVASRLAEQLLVVSGVPVFRDGNVLELQSTTLEVAQACSGLRSLISLSAVACLVAWAAERSWMRRALVVAAALPIAVALNGVRVALTGVACETWGPRMAKGGWHELAGWITFAAAIATLLAFQKLLPRVALRRAAPAAEWATS